VTGATIEIGIMKIFNKRMTSLIAGFALLMHSTFVCATQITDYELEFSVVDAVMVGESFDVDVFLDIAPGTELTTFGFDFDNALTQLSFDGFSMPAWITPDVLNDVGGLAELFGPSGSSIQIATLQFTALSVGSATVSAYGELFDNGGGAYFYDYISGELIDGSIDGSFDVNVVPEPSTLVLMLLSFWSWQSVLLEDIDVDALTGHTDLYRTFSDLAGAKIPRSKLPPGGRSLVPLLASAKTPWPDRKLFVHKGRWDDGRKNKMTHEENKFNNVAVRTEQWRLVYTLAKGKVQHFLSDINKDPGETINVAAKYPKVIKNLTAAYNHWWDSTEQFLVNEKLPTVSAKQQPLTINYNKQLKEKGIPNWSPIL